MPSSRKITAVLGGFALVSSGVALAAAAPAVANTAGTGLVINEVYGGGGSTSSSAAYKADFVELYNPTDGPLSVSGLSLQYRSATYSTGTVSVLTLPDKTVAAHDYFLVQVSSDLCSGNPCGGADVPAPDYTGTALNMSASGGQVILAQGTTGVTATGTAMQNVANVIDFVGYGSTATSSETAPTGTATSNTTSVQRLTSVDHDDNATDFGSPAAPSPTHSQSSGTQALAASDPGDKSGTVGSAIKSFDLSATGGTMPYHWTAAGLPPGILVSGSGTVSGTPTAAGSYTVTATVTDSATPAATKDVTFDFTISVPAARTIAQIQGTGATSPEVGNTVMTEGVVTAAYPQGGFYGYVIQTPGTGGADDATPGASDAIYVHQPSGDVSVKPGDYVQVTGPVSEYGGLTELSVASTDVKELDATGESVTPLVGDLPASATDREAHESELLDVSGQRFTVTDNYATNQYAEIGLATGDKPLITPTEVADAQDADAIKAVEDDNAQRAVTLDDGASTNFLSAANQDIPLPWLGTDNPVRVSSTATFHQPVILDYRNSTWKLQPTHQVTDEGKDLVTFSDTRSENMAPQDVGGDLKLATFNVLNYFPTTGVEYAAVPGNSCTYYVDRAGDPVTDKQCDPDGPRGAAEDEDLQRQQAKIVKAINTMDADIVSLEEIENSVKFGKDRDSALSTLVTALNDAAGTTRWAYVSSPTGDGALPPVADQDVIRTAFIYNPATVQPVGDSEVLVGSQAFYNARQPLAQAFKPKGADDSTTFGVIVNHFKSKGSGTNDGTGQGNANPDRVAQAHDLLTFADKFKGDRGIDTLFMTGDYNAYSKEDPVQVLEDGGYTNLQSDQPNEWTYNFDSMAGSLDHVFANAEALKDVTGVDIWNINADEAVAFEYSRDNYNATDFYQANQFRASDHDPEIVGIDVPGFPAEPTGPAATTVVASAQPMTYGTDGSVHVSVTGSGTPTGTVTLKDGPTEIGTATLGTDHTADITIPGDALEPGAHTLSISYAGDSDDAASNGTVDVTVGKALSTVESSVTPEQVQQGRTSTVTVTVSATGFTPTGTVSYAVDGTPAGEAALTDGTASFPVGPFDTTGTHTVTVTYSGDSHADGSQTTAVVDVTRSQEHDHRGVHAKVTPHKVVAGRTRAKLHIVVRAEGRTPTGTVEVTVGHDTYTAELNRSGHATVRLKKFATAGAKPVTIRYEGDKFTPESKTTLVIKVVSKRHGK